MKKKAIDYKKNKTVRLKEKKMKVELVLRNKKSGRRGAEKIRKILEVKLCGVCYNENEIMGKIKRRKKPILSMQMRRGKQKNMRSSWPPGPCQSSLSPFPFPSSHRLPLCTWRWQPSSLRLQYKR